MMSFRLSRKPTVHRITLKEQEDMAHYEHAVMTIS